MNNDTEEFYYKFNRQVDFKEKLLKKVLDGQTNIFQEHNAGIFIIEPEFFDNTVLSGFVRRFNTLPIVIELPPSTYYNLHVDRDRECAINMLIQGDSGKSSWTFFEKEKKGDLISVDHLQYEDNALYLFNTKTPHGILNISDKSRYILSIGFRSYPNAPTYKDILKICKERNL